MQHPRVGSITEIAAQVVGESSHPALYRRREHLDGVRQDLWREKEVEWRKTFGIRAGKLYHAPGKLVTLEGRIEGAGLCAEKLFLFCSSNADLSVRALCHA